MAFIVPRQFALSVCTWSFGTIHQITHSFKFATALHQQTLFIVNTQVSTAELPKSIKNHVSSLQILHDPIATYKQLLFFAPKLDPLPSGCCAEEDRIQRCVLQIWAKASLREEAVQCYADSHSQLAEGLAAVDLRSQDSHRGNRSDDGKTGNGDGPPSKTPVEDSIREKIIEALNPEQLLIMNESSKHAGHKGNPNNGPETHFKLEIVSSKFEGVNSVKRHRMVYTLLQEELAGPVHALALNTRTPMETK